MVFWCLPLKAIQGALCLCHGVLSRLNLVNDLQAHFGFFLTCALQPERQSLQLQMQLVLRRKWPGHRASTVPTGFHGISTVLSVAGIGALRCIPQASPPEMSRWLRDQLCVERSDLRIHKTSGLIRSQIVGGPDCIEADGLQTAVVRNG